MAAVVNDVEATLDRAAVLRALLSARSMLACRDETDRTGADLGLALPTLVSHEHFHKQEQDHEAKPISVADCSTAATLQLRVHTPLAAGCVPHAARNGLELSPDVHDASKLSAEEVDDVRRRGIALIAARPFARGELLWEEGPILSLQQDRHQTGRVCALCFHFLGGVASDAKRDDPTKTISNGERDSKSTPFDAWLRQLAWHCHRYGVAVIDDADGDSVTDIFDKESGVYSVSIASLLAAAEQNKSLRDAGFFADDAKLVIDRLRHFLDVARSSGDVALFEDSVACRNGCGELFCSTQCRDASWTADHRILCVGKLEDDQHPLVQFKLYASQYNDLLSVAARVATNIVCSAASLVESGSNPDNALKIASRLFDAYIGDSYISIPAEDPEDDDEQRHMKEEMVARSFELFRDALLGVPSAGVRGVANGAELVVARLLLQSTNWWDVLLGRLSLNSHGLFIGSPLHAALVRGRAAAHGEITSDNTEHPLFGSKTILERILVDDVVPSGLRQSGFNDNEQGHCAAAVLLPVLERVSEAYALDRAMHAGVTYDSSSEEDEEVEENKHDEKNSEITFLSNGSRTHDSSKTKGSNAVNEEMNQIAAALPGCEGLGTLAVAATMNHSCEPNTIVRYERHSFVGAVRALRDISVGEELTHSYIEEHAPEPDRLTDLRPYRFVCTCGVCESERPGHAVDPIQEWAA